MSVWASQYEGFRNYPLGVLVIRGSYLYSGSPMMVHPHVSFTAFTSQDEDAPLFDDVEELEGEEEALHPALIMSPLCGGFRDEGVPSWGPSEKGILLFGGLY